VKVWQEDTKRVWLMVSKIGFPFDLENLIQFISYNSTGIEIIP